MPIKTCAWVRARLPLLAGGDSLGLDRWMVEPHLLRCAECRERLDTLRASQAVLSAASADDPLAPPGDDPAPDTPSLWPEFSRRLRQAQRPSPRTAWGLERRHPWALPLAAGLAAGLLLCASLLTLGARRDPRIVELVNDYVPLDQILPVSSAPPRLLKPEDPEQFDARRPAPRFRTDAAYRESLATALPDDPAPVRSPNGVSPRPRVELTQ